MICKYKASIPGSKTFMREYEFKSEMKLYKLHEFLLNDLDFSPDQMVVFEGVVNGKVSREYGLFDMGDGSMDNVSIQKTLSRGETIIRYVYNLSTNSCLVLTFDSEVPTDPRASYPCQTAQKGHNPDQFTSKYEDDDFDQVHISSLPKNYHDEDDDADDQDYNDDELPEGEEDTK